MEIFLSTFVSKLDDKNRLSIPASFRAIIEKQGETVIYAIPSLKNKALEMCTYKQMQKLHKYIEGFDLFAPERQILETALLAAAEVMNIDSKGRICLSEKLLNFAKIGKEAAMVGKGSIFEIWAGEAFNADYQQAREFAIKNGIKLFKHEAKI